ncbi:MAG: undecaprenyldiphospho-muramoylpentapeptide beta-N-acetylglucosaminyltransferase [Gammaproteobacteria bacterium SHHR-1]|uniref:undecaprenyldiphospho-muramoylpentapeptide beta-N-acetylglucosaminyltransferase n=1 Tax=Magnetovirga frankeli TaxID=947516 RepID=UPI0012939BCE|nr:undecaprenyldiphospho-muramoylpentapeptide beta-N-acetylglucosaminyltransferase [gamma proteobacterium SS-5]
MARILIMAAGTGGHVFPGLALARELIRRGHSISWLGTPNGMENRLVPSAGIELDAIAIKGLRGNGLLRWLAAPLSLARALWQAAAVLRRRRPDLVIGMGGFVSGPGGLMARLLGIPLLIHEQNAVPGLANRLLSRIAKRVLQAFPDSFAESAKLRTVGNPVRREIAELAAPEQRYGLRQGPARLLIIGGSLGAKALNEQTPLALAGLSLSPTSALEVRHQSGRNQAESTAAAYRGLGIEAQVSEFIEDMAEAYAWCDLILCRAGALTVSELAAAGVPAILVPYPHAVDDHQTRNAAYLADAGAARLLPQEQMTPASLAGLLGELLTDRAGLLQMARQARALGQADATERVADICEEVLTA